MNRAHLPLAIVATFACAGCDMLEASGGQVDDTRAAFVHVDYVPPFGIVEMGEAPPHLLAIMRDGTLTFDGEPADPNELAEYLEMGSHPPASNVDLVIPADMPVAETLPLFQLLQMHGHEGARIVDMHRYRSFGDGVDSGETLPGEAYFRGTVNRYEFPAFVSYSPDTETCRTTFNGSAVSSEQLYERAFEKLDMIVMREGGPEAVVSNPEIMEALVATVQSPPDTPWRCVAGVTFHLIASGWPAIRYELVVDD